MHFYGRLSVIDKLIALRNNDVLQNHDAPEKNVSVQHRLSLYIHQRIYIIVNSIYIVMRDDVHMYARETGL